MNILRPSDQWKKINKTVLQNTERMSLDSFKSGPANHKISTWNPTNNGVRFLKELIFNLCEGLSDQEWKLLTAISNRHIGKPYAIKYNNELVCLDYLQAVFEIYFISKQFELNNKVVLEIGAGYGRTCHALLCNYDVSAYYIVDINNALTLAKRYLSKVLHKKLFKKIYFISLEEFNVLDKIRFDLCLNIDSFSEMTSEAVYCYLSFIESHCRSLFIKNPVGKYLDKSLDNHCEGDDAVKMALNSGVLRDVINIYDNNEVLGQVVKFIDVYSPGPEWRCIAHEQGRPWSFYRQAYFERRENGE